MARRERGRSLELKPPPRPRSEVATTSRWLSGRCRCRRAAAAPTAAPRRRGEVREHRGHALGVGPRGLGRLLRAAQLGRGDHLHRLRDLLRGLHGGDADLEVLEARHVAPARACSLSPRRWHAITRTQAKVLAKASSAATSAFSIVAGDLLVLVADLARARRRARRAQEASSAASKRSTSVDRELVEVAVGAGVDRRRPAPRSAAASTAAA